MQKQFEDNIIKNIRNLLKENKAIKDRILRDTRTFLNRNMIITKQYKQVSFKTTIILNMEVTVIE